MPPSHPPRTFDFLPEHESRAVRTGPKPKLEFPKFNGQNLRLWKDCCELYFEVYGVSDALKPRFAALNFKDTAACSRQLSCEVGSTPGRLCIKQFVSVLTGINISIICVN